MDSFFLFLSARCVCFGTPAPYSNGRVRAPLYMLTQLPTIAIDMLSVSAPGAAAVEVMTL